MKFINFLSIILTTCASLAFAAPSCTLEMSNEMDVFIEQIVCNEDGIFLNLGEDLLPISAIFETENGYKIVPRAGEKMITCQNCGASNPNYYIRCWKCNEPL